MLPKKDEGLIAKAEKTRVEIDAVKVDALSWQDRAERKTRKINRTSASSVSGATVTNCSEQFEIVGKGGTEFLLSVTAAVTSTRTGAGTVTRSTLIGLYNITTGAFVGTSLPVGATGTGNYTVSGAITIQVSVSAAANVRHSFSLRVANSASDLVTSIDTAYIEIKERPARLGE